VNVRTGAGGGGAGAGDATGPRQKNKPRMLLIGKKQNVVTAASTEIRPQKSIAAAKPFLQGIRKSMFYVDNVAIDVGKDDLETFVSKLGVQVISCREVKPRRSPRQRAAGIFPDNRRAFQVCIPYDHQHKFLDAKSWPEFISISSWVFKSKPAVFDRSDRRVAAASPVGDQEPSGSVDRTQPGENQQNQQTVYSTPDGDVTSDHNDDIAAAAAAAAAAVDGVDVAVDEDSAQASTSRRWSSSECPLMHDNDGCDLLELSGDTETETTINYGSTEQ
jgi:hypothetical protein